MGITSHTARLILREHRFRPITGKLLSIGMQTVYLTPEQAIRLVECELERRIDVDPESIEINMATRGAKDRSFISDRAFYRLFCDADYHCLDQSDYEGADIIFDLCNSHLTPGLAENFDFVYDGSTLDNVFDPPAALRNLVRMTRAGGRLFHVDRTSRVHNVYVAVALGWFHDYYSVNEFHDCQVYLAQWDNDPVTSRWDLYQYRPFREHDTRAKFFGQDAYFNPWRHACAVVIAEKGSHSTWNKNPIQFEYRPEAMNADIDKIYEALTENGHAEPENAYLKAAIRFSQSARPIIMRPDEKITLGPEFFNYAPNVVYCGSVDAILDASSFDP